MSSDTVKQSFTFLYAGELSCGPQSFLLMKYIHVPRMGCTGQEVYAKMPGEIVVGDFSCAMGHSVH
jgi:hypothetical protein